MLSQRLLSRAFETYADTTTIRIDKFNSSILKCSDYAADIIAYREMCASFKVSDGLTRDVCRLRKFSLTPT